MAINIAQSPYGKLLVTVTSTGTTATSSAFSIGYANCYTFVAHVTTATAGTLDIVFLTSIDHGTTYVNIPWRFAQLSATGDALLTVTSGLRPGAEAAAATGEGAATADTGGVLALSPVVDPQYMKIKYTIGTGPFAFTFYAIAQPRDSIT